MVGGRPRVWFERRVLPELHDEIARRVTMLGPVTATPDDPYRHLASAEGAVVSSNVYDADVMDRGRGLRVIARTGIGFDKVDIEAATARGIAVCNAPDGPTVSTAEHAVALMLAAAKRVKRAEARLRAGETDLYARHDAIELAGKVLGLVGCGRIARRVAAIGASLGMEVLAHDPYLQPHEFPAGVVAIPALGELLSRADVVSVHIPLTDQSRGLFGPEQFASMRAGSVFVNTSRGGIVDHDALVAVLASGRLLAAALDVTDPEPLPLDHPLLGRDDVIVTPHVASATAASKRRIQRTAFEQAMQVLGGQRPDHFVNPEVWDRVAAPRTGVS